MVMSILLSENAKEWFFANALICSTHSAGKPLKSIAQPLCKVLLGSLSTMDISCGSSSGILLAISLRRLIA